MADTADLRSEGKNSTDPDNVRARRKYSANKSLGICASALNCGNTAVKNRSYCYACSAYQAKATYKSGLRSFVNASGIDDVNNTIEILEDIDRRSMPDAQAEELDKVIALLKFAQKK